MKVIKFIISLIAWAIILIIIALPMLAINIHDKIKGVNNGQSGK